jgi:hypothetical protein
MEIVLQLKYGVVDVTNVVMKMAYNGNIFCRTLRWPQRIMFKGFVLHLYVVHIIPWIFLVDCVHEGLGHWCNGRTIHGLKVCFEFIAITP